MIVIIILMFRINNVVKICRTKRWIVKGMEKMDGKNIYKIQTRNRRWDRDYYGIQSSGNFIGYGYSKVNKDDGKLFEISQSIMPALIQKEDYSTIIQILNQLSQTLPNLFVKNKDESQKILAYIFNSIQQIESKIQPSEIQKIIQIFQIITTHIDKINETNIIIETYHLYLNFIEKNQGKQNEIYIQNLSKLSENCIYGEQYDHALNYLKQATILIQKCKIHITSQRKIQNLINLALVYLSQDNIQQSTQKYQQAYNFCKKHEKQMDFSSYKIAILQCLGDIFMNKTSYEEAIKHYEDSLSISTSYFIKSNINYLFLLFKIAKACFQLKNYQQVIQKCKIIEQRLNIQPQLKDQCQFYTQMILLFGNSFMQLSEKQEMTIKYFQEYIANSQKSIIVDEKTYLQILNNLSNINLKIGNIQQSLKYLRSIYKFYKSQGNQLKKDLYKNKIANIESKSYI